jgi:hypothetical protein
VPQARPASHSVRATASSLPRRLALKAKAQSSIRSVAICGVLLCLAACSRSDGSVTARRCPISLAGHAEIRALHAKRQLHLPDYWTTGAAWSDSDPILVGREFDFAFALGNDLGAGIAAQQRQKATSATAKRVAAAGPHDLVSSLLAALAPVPGWCERMSGRPIPLYAVLFGDKDARLQVVLDLRPSLVPDASLPITQLVAVSDAHPLEGSASWLGDHGEAVRRAIRSAAEGIARLASVQLKTTTLPVEGARVECAIGGPESWHGFALASTAGLADHALVTSGPDATLVFCTNPLVPDRTPRRPPLQQ